MEKKIRNFLKGFIEGVLILDGIYISLYILFYILEVSIFSNNNFTIIINCIIAGLIGGIMKYYCNKK